MKPILFGIEAMGGSGGIGLGTVELNRPEVLNALNTAAYEMLESRLLEWARAPEVAAVVISSRHPRAFCAGGDVKDLVLSTQQHGIAAAIEFFTREYFVDGLIHAFPKPVIAVCNGITMGGGLGLAMGAGLRVATETTQVAMPELAIGLFPDVGATRFLQNLKPPYGLFMGLTGARLTGVDAVHIGLFNAFVPTSRLRQFQADLIWQKWGADAKLNQTILSRYLVSDEALAKYVSDLKLTPAMTTHDARLISDIFSGDSLQQIDKGFLAAKGLSPWLSECRERYENGSALSRATFFAAWQRHRGLSITETLKREWEMAIHFCKDTEFAEGVRAVLIDKDHAPKWRYQNLAELWHDSHFEIEALFHSGQPVNLLAEKFAQLPT